MYIFNSVALKYFILSSIWICYD